MTRRRVDLWHPPTTPPAFAWSGIVLLAGTFFPTNPSPGVTAAAGAALVGIAVWRNQRLQNSEPSAGGDSATTAVDGGRGYRADKRAA